jgi:subtilisin family serine protease
MIHRCCVLAALFLMVQTTPVRGGVVDPALRDAMAARADTTRYTVMARLVDRAVLGPLDAALKRGQATRAERHRMVVETLRAKAAATQSPLIDLLNREGAFVASWWIDNLVEFRGTPALIEQVAARPDVEIVFVEPVMIFDQPIDLAYAPEALQTVENGVRAIRAPQLWRIGVTGEGSIVMNIDTGVKGDHAALASRWRGALPGIPPSQAWYKPDGSTFPTDSDNPGHGTHTMGIMTGCNPLTGDTVGVAPGATWIAGSGSYTGAFQWAVDPDGDPFTLTDVPDVINCSWFTGGDPCGGGGEYWSLMDNVEMSGAVVIWSAGNCGPGGSSSSCADGVSPGSHMTITPPKNRASSDVNAFAVGAVDGNSATYPIAGFSSRGPSACDTVIIKPEVSAPGVSVRSTVASGSFGFMSGTSMAAPHVSGAVALLRQVNPEADADMIKLALLATARDLGTPGEDNSYGMGLIDVFAAAEAVSPYRLSGTVRSAATGLPVRNARVTLLESGQDRRVDTAGAYALNPLLDTVTVKVTAFAYSDTMLNVVLTAGTPVVCDVALSGLPVYPVGGSVTDASSGLGIAAELRWYALEDSSGAPTYVAQTVAGGSYTFQAVAAAYRVEIVAPVPYAEQTVVNNVIVSPSGASLSLTLSPARVLMADDDNGMPYDTLFRASLYRLGIPVRTVAMSGGGSILDSVLEQFPSPPVLLWFTGNDSTDALTPEERRLVREHLAAGGNAILTGQNVAQFAPASDSLLEQTLGVQFAGNNSQGFIIGFPGDVIGGSISFLIGGGAGNQTSKDALHLVPGSSGTPVPTFYYAGDTASLAGVRVTGPGSTWGVTYFGFGLEGIPPARMDSLLLRSMRFFDQLVTGVDEQAAPGIPQQVVLEQNYPNPFNPVTRIRYGLPGTSRVRVTVYDIIGREVATLAEGEQSGGFHDVQWDGTEAGGVPVASGLYFCRLEVAGETSGIVVRKMLLLK